MDTFKDPMTLNARLLRGSDSSSPRKKIKERYYFSPDTETEWGHVADSLALAMLEMYCEYEFYDIAQKLISIPRIKSTLNGRMQGYTIREDLKKKQETVINSGRVSEVEIDSFRDVSSLENREVNNETNPVPGNSEAATGEIEAVAGNRNIKRGGLELGGSKKGGSLDSLDGIEKNQPKVGMNVIEEEGEVEEEKVVKKEKKRKSKKKEKHLIENNDKVG